jgi:transcriptional antiterminator NusG
MAEKEKDLTFDLVEEEVSGVRAIREPMWYVVHTYSGHENKVKVNIEKLVENREMQDLVLSVVVPTEDVIELKNGQRKIKTRKMFPGYVLVKMIVTNESWYLVRNTQGVTGFVGHGSEPVPLTVDEVRRMGIEKIIVEMDIKVGDSVKVINGPFEGFMGSVSSYDEEKQTMRVLISMFGRDTLVELEYAQIDKL